MDYFELRKVPTSIDRYSPLPAYMVKLLSGNKSWRILDYGFGFGSLLFSLKNAGYDNVFGADISSEALKFTKENGLTVFDCRPIFRQTDRHYKVLLVVAMT